MKRSHSYYKHHICWTQLVEWHTHIWRYYVCLYPKLSRKWKWVTGMCLWFPFPSLQWYDNKMFYSFFIRCSNCSSSSKVLSEMENNWADPCFYLSKPYSFLATSGLFIYWVRIIVIIWIINSESWVIKNYNETVNRNTLQYYFYGSWGGL